MNSQEIYKKFLLQVNKNDTNKNVKVPKSQFVLLYNEQKRKWLNDDIKKDENSDYIDEIKELLELDHSLTKTNETTTHTNFKLPDDFFRKVSSYSLASRDKCKDVVLTNWFVKPKNINVLLQNSNTNPSFDYRETPAVLNKDGISVYKEGFEIDKVYLSYYRNPKDIDIEGYTKIDGSQSTDVDSDLSDENTEKVIRRTATEAVRNYESPEQLQLALQRETK